MHDEWHEIVGANCLKDVLLKKVLDPPTSEAKRLSNPPQSLIILQVQVAASKLSWDEQLVTLFIVLFQMFLHVGISKKESCPFLWTAGHLFQQSSAILRKRQKAIFGAFFPHVLDVFEAQIDHVIYAIPQNTQVGQVLQSARCKTICTDPTEWALNEHKLDTPKGKTVHYWEFTQYIPVALFLNM